MNYSVKIKLLLYILSLSILFYSCKSGSGDKAKSPVQVNIIDVKHEYVIYYDSYPGTVVPLNLVELRGEVTGYITGIYFSDAQTVQKGQKLYEIDRSKYLASYEQAKANVDIASSNLDKTQLDANRYAQLSEQDAVAKQRLDYAQTDLINAKLQLIAAKAELAKTETDLRYSIITAPFDGTIGISQVKLGTLITPGQTILNIISSDNPIAVDFVIDEKSLIRFQKFNFKGITDKDSVFRIVLSDNSTYPYNGTLSFIDRAVDPQTGTIKVRLIFQNKNKLLKAGMSCNVKVLNQGGGSQIVIPFKAVIEQMGEYFVFIEDSAKAKQTKINVGLRMGDKIIVREGLKEGSKIVIDGIQKLQDGAPIKAGDLKTQSSTPIK